MSFSIVPIINSIPNIENMSFLELGVWDGKNHKQILCKDKASVDIAWNPTFKMTTTRFFQVNGRRYDIVFIDADHRLEGGLYDYNHATRICDKFIIMHDLYPDNEQQVTDNGDFAGDIFKLLYHIIKYNVDIRYYVLDGDCGMTVFLPPFNTFDFADIDQDVTYDDLKKLQIGRFSIEGMQEILRQKL